MNGAFESTERAAGPLRIASLRGLLGGFGVPAMALVSLVAIIAILLGLQCGGLDKCFGVNAQASVARVNAKLAAEAPTEASVVPVVAASAVDQPVARPVTEVAMTKPALSGTVIKAQRADEMIGATFTALAADDAGWLAGASAATATAEAEVSTDADVTEVATADEVTDSEIYDEGDGAGPQELASTGETAIDAVTTAAIDRTPVEPLQRPKPLEVAAFVEEQVETPPAVKAEAKKKLVAVAKPAPVEEPAPAAKPAPKPKAAAAEPKQAEPKAETKVAVAKQTEPKQVQPARPDPVAGEVLTVAGDGVNVRAGPGKSQEKLFALAGGKKVRVGENRQGWLQVTDEEGRTGWVYKNYLE